MNLAEYHDEIKRLKRDLASSDAAFQATVIADGELEAMGQKLAETGHHGPLCGLLLGDDQRCGFCAALAEWRAYHAPKEADRGACSRRMNE